MKKLHRDFRRTSAGELDAISQRVATLGANAIKRVEPLANIIAAFVLGLLGLLLLWHWLSRCPEASLCMAIVSMPRRRPYIPAGCDQQSRVPAGRGALTHEELRAWPWENLSRPDPLKEDELDQHNHEMHPRSNFGELVFFGGAVSRYRGRGLLERLRHAWREWSATRRIARLGPRL